MQYVKKTATWFFLVVVALSAKASDNTHNLIIENNENEELQLFAGQADQTTVPPTKEELPITIKPHTTKLIRLQKCPYVIIYKYPSVGWDESGMLYPGIQELLRKPELCKNLHLIIKKNKGLFTDTGLIYKYDTRWNYGKRPQELASEIDEEQKRIKKFSEDFKEQIAKLPAKFKIFTKKEQKEAVDKLKAAGKLK